MIRVPYVKDKAQVEKVIEEAKENNGIICYTVVSPELREHIAHKAMEHDVEVRCLRLLKKLPDCCLKTRPD